MGMYTELVFKSNLVFKTNSVAHRVFDYLLLDGTIPDDLPDHPFFKATRWSALGRCSSYYHHPAGVRSVVKSNREDDMQDWYVFMRTDIKDYDGEIRKFIDWVTPYTHESASDCIGWEWHEEDDQPTLIFKK